MSTAGPYGLEIDDDDDPNETVMHTVVNVTDEPIKFRIASVPGTKPLRYNLAPYGKPGDRVPLQAGYAQPYKGAGRDMIQPIIERLTSRHVGGHEGAKLPMVVGSENERAGRAAWLAAHKAHRADKAKKPIALSIEIDPANLEPRAAKLRREPTKFVGEEVGLEPIEPPHPDDEPIIVDGPGPEPEPLEGDR